MRLKKMEEVVTEKLNELEQKGPLKGEELDYVPGTDEEFYG